ncbi:hypothetical protein BCV72DRAFT_218546, partial [Rhizopus microsporus var. microsporus]
VEAIGRRKTLDTHRGSFRIKNGEGSTCTSLPVEDTNYENAFPTIIMNTDGTKLVIRIKAFNASITSNLHLDALVNPEVGPSTVSFYLNNRS